MRKQLSPRIHKLVYKAIQTYLSSDITRTALDAVTSTKSADPAKKSIVIHDTLVHAFRSIPSSSPIH